MNLHNYWLSSEVAKKLGIAPSNFTQLAKVDTKRQHFKKVGNMLFMKFNPADFKQGIHAYREELDSKINAIVKDLTVWDTNYPTAAFVDDVNITISNVTQLSKVEGGKYLEMHKTADGKSYVTFKGALLDAVKNGHTLYSVTQSELDDLEKDEELKGKIKIKNTYLVWY
jgi:hypothetical protein